MHVELRSWNKVHSIIVPTFKINLYYRQCIVNDEPLNKWKKVYHKLYDIMMENINKIHLFYSVKINCSYTIHERES